MKYLCLLSFLLCSFSVFSQIEDPKEKVRTDMIPEEESPVEYEVPQDDPVEEIYMLVEDMPVLKGCEVDSSSSDEQKICTQKKMSEHIASQMEYPQVARGSGIQGTWHLTFIVNEEKEIEQIKIKKSPAKGKDISTEEQKVYDAFDQEANRLVKSLEFATSGKQRGKPVKVQYKVPVIFTASH